MKLTPKRKRRGRPPGRDKTAVFSTRLRQETRAALEAASAASGKSLSQEIEERLQGSFQSAGVRSGLDKQPDHVQALAVLVALLTEKIEAATELSWRTDERVRHAIMGGLEAMFAALRHGVSIPMSWDEMYDRTKSMHADMEPAHYYGALTACPLLYHLPTAKFEAVAPEALMGGTSATDVARLAWVREKLGIQNPRGFSAAQEKLLGLLRGEDSPSKEPKYARKKS